MDETEWIALLVILNTSFVPIVIVYIHGYGYKEGWTWILDFFVNKQIKSVLGFPSLFVLFYFAIILTFQATAAFLTVKIFHEQVVYSMVPLDDSDCRIQDVILAVFLTNSALLWLWLKSFFNPPPAVFPALVLSIMLVVSTIVSLVYYWDLHDEPHGFPLSTNTAPFVLALLYFIFGPCLLFLVSFYLFANSKLKEVDGVEHDFLASQIIDSTSRSTGAGQRTKNDTNRFGFSAD